MTGEFDPLFGKPPCPYTREDCLPACEHGYAGPCERYRSTYPPGDKNEDDDDIDKRLESAMLTLERTVQEVSVMVSEFRASMVKLRLATQFLFWTFVVLGLCFLWLGWRNLP